MNSGPSLKLFCSPRGKRFYRPASSFFETDGGRFFPNVGANNVYNQVDHPIPTAPFYIPIQFEYEEVGVFLTDTIDLGKGWSALLGGRFSHYDNHYPTDPASDDTESAFSPTVALMFEPTEGLHTYVTYTRALQDGGFANRTANNAWEPLGIQESEQFEVGVKTRSRDGRFSGELALFQLEQDVALINDNNIDESYYESGEFYPGDAGYLAYGEPLSANFSLQIDF